MAITCCSAVVNLGSRRISCPLSVFYLEDALVKLMDFSLNLAPVDKLHQLATEAGFEVNFLSHFGRKVLPSETTEDLEFWIGLAHKKLLKAFCEEESIISNKQNFQHKVNLLIHAEIHGLIELNLIIICTEEICLIHRESQKHLGTYLVSNFDPVLICTIDMKDIFCQFSIEDFPSHALHDHMPC